MLSGNIRYTIQKRQSEDTILINAFDGDKMVGHFLCQKSPYCDKCYPELYCKCEFKKEKIWIMKDGPQVLDAYKKQGIGRAMYRIAEIHFKLKIMPDGKASEEGKQFRTGYEKRYGNWTNEFEKATDDSELPIVEEVPHKKDSFVR